MNDNEFETKVRELHRLRLSIGNLKTQEQTLTNDVKQEMRQRNSSKLLLGDFQITFRAFKKRRFNARRFKKEHEDLYNDYLDTVSSSRLTIS